MRRPSKADGDSTDEQLMQSLVAGKDTEEVLRTLYRRYVRTVYGTGSKLLGDRSLAEELVQEVFLKVW